MSKNTLIEADKTYAIIGACMAVHRTLGVGFLESVYNEALAKELTKRKIPFEREKKLYLYYNGEKMNKHFKADFVCYNSIILEIKSKNSLIKVDEQQIINYLKATNHEVGLLVNFGEKSLKYKRFINTRKDDYTD